MRRGPAASQLHDRDSRANKPHHDFIELKHKHNYPQWHVHAIWGKGALSRFPRWQVSTFIIFIISLFLALIYYAHCTDLWSCLMITRPSMLGVRAPLRPACLCPWHDRSQPLTPGWARREHFLNFSLFSSIFSHYSSIFLHFFPQFGLPGGRVAHPGRPWLRHWSLGKTLNLKLLRWPERIWDLSFVGNITI